MTNKDRTILACWKLAEKYRNPQGKEFFIAASCDLCKIHLKEEKVEINDSLKCGGCPLSTKTKGAGCSAFDSNRFAQQLFSCTPGWPVYLKEKASVVFTRRAEFFEKIIPILEKIPAKRFTKRGWTYFEELDRAW